MRRIGKNLAAIVTTALILQAAGALSAQQSTPPPPPSPGRIRVTTELVLVNVVARDKKGNLVLDLKKDDFTLLEDGKKQQISSFDFENVDQVMTAAISSKARKRPLLPWTLAIAV
jgi:hypothetical protein